MPVMDVYVRVSRVGDREGEEYRSPTIQIEEAKRWADNNEVTIGKVLVDEDVSGATPISERKLEKLIVRTEKGESEGVIVYRTSRFARDSYELFSAVKRLNDVGGRLVGAGDGVDTAQPGGKLILGILAAIAENYLEEIRGGWKASVARAVADGIHVASKAPLGYLRRDQAEPEFNSDGDLIKNGRLVVDLDTAPVVKEAFRMRAVDHAPYQRIAEYMSDALGRTIVRSTVRSILQNRAYLGEARGPQGALNTDAHEAIVEVPVWEAAQPARSVKKPREGSAAEGALLSGIILCDGCGYVMRTTATKNVKTGERETSYVCGVHHSTGDCPAPAGGRSKGVDEFFTARFQEAADTVLGAVQSAEQRVIEATAAVRKAEADLDEWIEDLDDNRARLGKARFQKGVDARSRRLDDARRVLWDMDDYGIDPDDILFGDSDQPIKYEVWGKDMNADRRRVRRCLKEVRLEKADPKRRRWQPIEERVKIEWVGAEDSEPVAA
jgi:DNA invertase Pin-like site-specific DNA recombinase